MFIRGGNANFNKVLVDGIPVNDIGGAFDLGQMSTGGVERVEVLRQTNSVVYGSDALAGVINITTKRGRTRVPEVEYSIDGGNLDTFATTFSVGGVARRFDYFSSYSRFDTNNDVPNNAYENGTYAGRFGAAIAGNTDLSVSIRRIDSEYESSNAILNYGIADDSSQDKQQTCFTASARTLWTDRLQSTIRFGWTDEQFAYVNPTPTGEPFDPVWLRRQLSGQYGHAQRRGRAQRNRPRHPRLWRNVSLDIRDAHGPPARFRRHDVLCARDVCRLGWRALRTGARL